MIAGPPPRRRPPAWGSRAGWTRGSRCCAPPGRRRPSPGPPPCCAPAGTAGSRTRARRPTSSRRPAGRCVDASVVVGLGAADAHAADGVQVARLRGGLAELAAYPGQVHVDRAVTAAVRLLPHLGEQGALGDHLAPAAGEGEQQVELLAGEVDLRPG